MERTTEVLYPSQMRIALISPKGPLYRHRTGIFRKSLRACPLTLSTLASLVPNELNAEIKVYDEGVEDLPRDVQADLVGMTVITGNAPRSYELSAEFRRRGIPVVLGGPHVTLIPDDAEEHADSLVTGYAEETWPRLLRDFSAGQMKRRYEMDPDFSFARIPNLPFPRRDLMNGRQYLTTNTFEATRGCIHKCEFCVVPSAWGRKPFQKPIEYIVEDIRRTGAKRLIFYDLNIIANRTYAKDLFRALIPLKIQWFGLSTVLIVKDAELLDLVVKSGCKGLLVGLESISTSSLTSIDKEFNDPASYPELIRTLHDCGIAVNGTFVFGTDADTKDVFDSTIEFVIKNRIDLPRFSIATPFPNTALYKRLVAEKRLLTKNWSLYDGQHVVFSPKQMTPEDLLQGHERVWNSVYSINGILRRLRVRNFDPLLYAATNLGYRFYASNLSRFYTCNGGIA